MIARRVHVRHVARPLCRKRWPAKNLTTTGFGAHTETMDLPRAEIRYRGLPAVAAAIIRRLDRIGGWIRPRAAPLAITVLATLCMLAGLDLIARDFRKLREYKAPPQPMVIYLVRVPSQPAPIEIIPVELVPAVPTSITPAPAP